MYDIKVMLTHEEAKKLFYKTADDYILSDHSWTGVDETGEPESEIQWVYDWMGCGRTAWGVRWEDIPKRVSGLLKRLISGYSNLERPPKVGGHLIFSAEKEVYPPKFRIILY